MRIISIILTSLATDRLKFEENLQRLINNKDTDLDTNIYLIKNQLREIVLIDKMIMKWKDYTTTDDNNNNNNE